MQEQLDRIEDKLDKYALQTTANSTDIVWIKRIIGAAGSLVALIGSYLFRKLG